MWKGQLVVFQEPGVCLTWFHGFFKANFQFGTAPVSSDFLFPSTKEKKSISITEFIFIYSAQNIVKRKNFNQINYIQ